MRRWNLIGSLLVLSFALLTTAANAQVSVLAIGALEGSSAGSYADLSGLTYTLENDVPANLLGGLGSGIAWASGNTIVALPDRGPNAVSFNPLVDDTVSYVNRFHTISLNLQPNTGGGLPFVLTPTLQKTTLLFSPLPLVYGSGDGLNIGSGVPPINTRLKNYFTGRSDNFDPSQNSGDAADARFDTEGIRVSNDLKRIYISDEYGPYIYRFNRSSGLRNQVITLPDKFAVTALFPVGSDEIASNIEGRVANKGMEGLAITPDGKTLVGIMQSPLIQDGGTNGSTTRIVVIDIETGTVLHEYAYKCDNIGTAANA